MKEEMGDENGEEGKSLVERLGEPKRKFYFLPHFMFHFLLLFMFKFLLLFSPVRWGCTSAVG